MTAEEFNHGHFVMAVFCGWEAQKANATFPNGYLMMRPEEGDEQPETVSNEAILEELPYGSDWNYLMAAWNIFRELDIHLDRKDPVSEAILEVDLNRAFAQLIRGIEEYNQVKIEQEV